jgi:PAS domain S-box-containing protein
MGWLCALVGLFAVWVIVLRRQVDHLNEAVRQQLERHATLDERYADLVGSVTDVVFAMDLQGRCTAVNAASQAVTGLARADVLRGSVFDLIPPEQHEAARQRLARAAANAGRGDMRFKTTIVAKDGRVVNLVGHLRLVTHGGTAIGFEGIAHPAAGRPSADRAADAEHQLVA